MVYKDGRCVSSSSHHLTKKCNLHIGKNLSIQIELTYKQKTKEWNLTFTCVVINKIIIKFLFTSAEYIFAPLLCTLRWLVNQCGLWGQTDGLAGSHQDRPQGHFILESSTLFLGGICRGSESHPWGTRGQGLTLRWTFKLNWEMHDVDVTQGITELRLGTGQRRSVHCTHESLASPRWQLWSHSERRLSGNMEQTDPCFFWILFLDTHSSRSKTTTHCRISKTCFYLNWISMSPILFNWATAALAHYAHCNLTKPLMLVVFYQYYNFL